MSNTQLVAEPDLKMSQTVEDNKIPETIGLDHRSQEMLVVLNEVFDSICITNNSSIVNF
jgi:hypothetical protein